MSCSPSSTPQRECTAPIADNKLTKSRWYKNTFVPPYPKSMQGVPEELEKNNGTHMPAVYYDDSKHYLDDKYPGDFRSSFAIE